MTRWVTALGDALRTTFLGGASLFRLAPVIPLLVVLPEFAQHVVEIALGMFASKAAFAAGGGTTLRMAFGIAKVVGLFAAILAAARYWSGARERWWRGGDIPGKRFLLALVINIGVTAAIYQLGKAVSAQVASVLDPLLSVLTFPLIVYLIGPLMGDQTMTLRRAYTAGWIKALAMGALAVAAFWPLQWLHHQNHVWAIGAPEAAVWALMVFDSLLVGLIACCTGAALAAGYRLGEPAPPVHGKPAPAPA